MTFLSPNVGGHDSPFKGSRFHHPKKGTKNYQVVIQAQGCRFGLFHQAEENPGETPIFRSGLAPSVALLVSENV